MEGLKAYKECYLLSKTLKQSPLVSAEYLLKGQKFRKFKYELSSLPLSLNILNSHPNTTQKDNNQQTKTTNPISENDRLTQNLTRELDLQTSIVTNQLKEIISNLATWKTRLIIVKRAKRKLLEQALAENNPEALGVLQANASPSDFTDSMNSQTWKSSESGTSAYSILTGIGPGGRFKRGRQPKNLIDRRCKPGSVYEEDWLTQSLNKKDIQPKTQKDVEHLLDLLLRFGRIAQARELLSSYKTAKVALHNKSVFKTVLQGEFERGNPEVFDIYSHIKEFNPDEISKGSRAISEKDVLSKFNFLIM